ncbi:hypothetical protein D9M70_479790 [compost metagenome]
MHGRPIERECLERPFEQSDIETVNDKYDPRVTIVVGPAFHMNRRMYQMLNAMDGDRPLFPDDVEDTLHAQDAFAVAIEQHGEPEAEGCPVHRPFHRHYERGHGGRMCRAVSRRQHCRTIAVETAGRLQAVRTQRRPLVDESGKIDCRVGGKRQRRVRIDDPQFDRQRRHNADISQIRLCDDQAIGDRCLAVGFHIGLELCQAVDRVDRGDDVSRAEMMAQHRVRLDRGEDRKRVGKAGAFDDDAPERRNQSALAL